MLNEEPNVNRLPTPSEERKIVVVGDLHGSLGDLDKVISTLPHQLPCQMIVLPSQLRCG